MAELSKTAKASMVKAPKKEQAVETTEEAIRQIRMDRAGQLFIVRMDRIDKLLAAYDVATERATKAEADLQAIQFARLEGADEVSTLLGNSVEVVDATTQD